MFFKNNPGKIASLKNYNESQCPQNEHILAVITDDDDFRKLQENKCTKNNH